MNIIDFDKKLENIPDIHENIDTCFNYVNWFHSFPDIKKEAIINVWLEILSFYDSMLEFELSRPNPDYKKIQNLKIIKSISLEQIIWIIEFQGNGVTSWKKENTRYEKSMFNAFDRIKTKNDIKLFKEKTIICFKKIHQ